MINEIYVCNNSLAKVLDVTLNTKDVRLVTYLREGKTKKMRLDQFKRIFTKIEPEIQLEIQKPKIDWTEAFEPELEES